MPSYTVNTKLWRRHCLTSTLSGRLGTYKYYNMDQVVAQALAEYEKLSRKWSAPARKVTIALPQSMFNLNAKATADVEESDGEAA